MPSIILRLTFFTFHGRKCLVSGGVGGDTYIDDVDGDGDVFELLLSSSLSRLVDKIELIAEVGDNCCWSCNGWMTSSNCRISALALSNALANEETSFEAVSNAEMI